jgi:cytosine/adenosine deaminase-related metal-dependent hydrolase
MTRKILLCCLAALLACAAASAQNAKLIVKDAKIFSMAPSQREPFNGYLVVAEDGTLTAVGPGDPPASLAAKETYDAHGDWVIPGFISAHSHIWQSAYRGLAADQTLTGWIDALYGRTAPRAKAEDFYWFTLHGSLDHLAHGVTAAYDFNYGGPQSYDFGHPPPSSQSPEAYEENQFRAEMDSGLRFVHGFQVGRAGPKYSNEDARRALKAFLGWTATQPKSTAFLSVMINGGTAFNDTYQQAVMEKSLMDEFHLGNETHYLEPRETAGEEQSKFRWFMDSGLLSKQLIFGHFIHTNDFILQKTAAAGASMSWNPLSNGRLASGTADIPKYLKMGVRVGMGVDGEASADIADPFENMRTGLYAIRDKYENAAIMSPYDVLRLHTMGSADVLGVADKLGSLERGKYADFLVISTKRFGYVFDPYASLVFIGAQGDIKRVYVGGELLVENGKTLKQDFDKVQSEVDQRVAASVK